MKKQGIQAFPNYFVGVDSLAQLATRKDRICVLNILGGESRTVTPISHAYSGGNVLFGTSPGRAGQVLETAVGDIPVYNNVREGMEAGHRFNVGVVYLPPAGVRDGVAELIRVNSDLEKVIILTEKVSVHDAREIRALGQQGNVDVFGANCLGIADSWNHVRFGGALGGDKPEETLRKGCIAIYSNSGNFTTTIANYLGLSGWGTTTLVSSGKDVYIHYAPAEWAHGLANDARSKGAVMYVEPGGYYEQDLNLTKPTVACVVGRWKAKLTRAVGHAGAIAGSGDDAAAKEKWCMDQFGVDEIFTPDNPVVSAQGAVVINISHIPAALTEVMALNGVEPDFPPEGNLELKPWFGNNQGIKLPTELDLPIVKALSPYDDQIAAIGKSVGTSYPRQSMKDSSGCSIMDAKTQVTKIFGRSILDLSSLPLESNACMVLLEQDNGPNDNALMNTAIAAYVNMMGDPALAAADAARAAGNAPNSVLAAATSILGPKAVDGARKAADVLIDLFAHLGLMDGTDTKFKLPVIKPTKEQLAALTGESADPKALAMLDAIRKRKASSVFTDFLHGIKGHITADAVLAAITTTIAWSPLMRKRVSRLTVYNLPWYIRCHALMIGVTVPGKEHKKDKFNGIPMKQIMESWTMTELAYLALANEKPTPEILFPFQVLLGLLISNGVGTISAQGAKGGVAADGPESPERVQINKSMVGFLTHTGFAHGGNGYEGIQFLIENFKGRGLDDAANPKHGLDLKQMAEAYATAFGDDKKARKVAGESVRNIPGVNHPVFKGKVVNKDPREVFIDELFKKRNEYNIFHDFYQNVAQALFDAGVTKNVFCVNIDAVIAALLLKLLWPRYISGDYSEASLETAAFTAFLFGRMTGCAGEIDDHMNRGRNMDTRTPASKVSYVS